MAASDDTSAHIAAVAQALSAPSQPNGGYQSGTRKQQSNLEAADAAMNLTPQERALYQRHLTNLYGSGGVDNPDGSRSTLYQTVEEHNGRFYNVPTVWNGRVETQPWTRPSDGKTFSIPSDVAMANIKREGWDNFPSYASPEEADARYEQMHSFMEKDTADYFAQLAARSGATSISPQQAETGNAIATDDGR